MSNAYRDRLLGIGLMFKQKTRLPYGEQAPSQMVKTNGIPSLILSEGALEQEEIDYIALAVKEKEDTRLKKKKTKMREELDGIVGAVSRAPKGQRAKAARELMRRD